MSILKRKKSNTGKVVAGVVGGAVAAGVAYLATTKKGKAMVKDAKAGANSLLKTAAKKEKKLEKKVMKTLGKAQTAVSKAKQSVRKASDAASKEKTAVKRTLRSSGIKRKA